MRFHAGALRSATAPALTCGRAFLRDHTVFCVPPPPPHLSKIEKMPRLFSHWWQPVVEAQGGRSYPFPLFWSLNKRVFLFIYLFFLTGLVCGTPLGLFQTWFNSRVAAEGHVRGPQWLLSSVVFNCCYGGTRAAVKVVLISIPSWGKMQNNQNLLCI